MRPHLVGIAGPSCSGKSELTRDLAARLPGSSVIALDSYYLDLAHLSLAERAQVNFDHPDTFDWRLLRDHLEQILSGRAIDEPGYSFELYTRAGSSKRVEPAEFVLVEGLFMLYWPELRSLLDTKIYVQASDAVCFERRLRRDVAERGRSPESVRAQYERTVKPGAEQFVFPTRQFAGLVVSGEDAPGAAADAVWKTLRRENAAAGGR